MESNEAKLLEAIHQVEGRLIRVEENLSKYIDNRLDDGERRITNLESNQAKLVWAILLSVIGSVMTLILK